MAPQHRGASRSGAVGARPRMRERQGRGATSESEVSRKRLLRAGSGRYKLLEKTVVPKRRHYPCHLQYLPPKRVVSCYHTRAISMSITKAEGRGR